MAIYKNCIYLTSFLSQIDHLVSFQLQIQHEKSIEDLNSGCSPGGGGGGYGEGATAINGLYRYVPL